MSLAADHYEKLFQKFDFACDGCIAAVDALIEVVHLGTNFDTLASIIETVVCPLIPKLSTEVCRGAVKNFEVGTFLQ